MVLVDTSIWVDYFWGMDTPQTQKLDRLLEAERIVIGDLIFAELLQGFRSGKDLAAARKMIDKLEYRDLAGKEICLKAADNYRWLRTRGITVRKTIDVIIGTFCLENGIGLLHNDRDFDPMEKHLGLRTLR